MRGRKRGIRGRVSVGLSASALVVVMVLLLSGAALAAPPWSDAPNSWWVSTYQLTDQEIGTVGEGYPDGTFRPQLDVTREQFAKMVVDGMGLPTATPPVPTFKDVPATNYFYPWIEGGAAARIISGFTDGSFGPKNNIVRQQANSILGSYLAQKELNLRGHIAGSLANYPSLNTWYLAEGMAVLAAFADSSRVATVHAPATAYLIFRGVVQGSYSNGAMYLGPNNNLTRAQAAALIMRVKAIQFSTALPTVTLLNPSTGPATGGNTVVITGTNFTNVISVHFGTKSVAFTANSATQITVTAPVGTLGTTVDVVVTTPAGDSATGAASKYTYGIPTVTGLNPASGPAAGGNTVVITGTNLTGAAGVKFGTKSATSFTVDSSTKITAKAPSGTAGTTVDVAVTTGGGTTATSAASKYSYGAPTVTKLTPASGPAVGGNSVTITGTGFSGVTTVKFGAKTTDFVVTSPTSITVQAPSGDVGSTVDVTVTTAAGTSATSANSKYSYGGPSVSSLTPTSGPTSGGNTVVITGTGFSGVTSVAFGTKSATAYTVNSSTQITAVAPSNTAGTVVDVRVITASGTSAVSTATKYTYGASITSVSPYHGPAAGGNLVIINGSGFTGATSVLFGSTTILSPSFVVNPTGTVITVIHAPAGNGKVDIRVNVGTVQSGNTAADDYTYAPKITQLTPASGSLAGGNTVTITGTGFTGATAARFGGVAGTSFNVVSDTTITVKAPPKALAGTVQVQIIGKYDPSADNLAHDDYTYGGPVVTGLTPNHGPAAGTNQVVINGTGFTGASLVKFGGTSYAPAAFTVNAAGTAITLPSIPSGTSVVDVLVTVAGTESANTVADNYTYAPTITADINPKTGSTAGGTVVTITGTGFTGATGVTFGGTLGTALTVINDTSLTITSPARATAGTVQVRVNGKYDPSINAGTFDDFTYTAGPVVTNVEPNVGPSGAPTDVTITGLNFQTTGATGVMFGANAGVNFVLVSDTQITVTTNGGTGVVDVIVQSPAGNSPVSASAKFKYSPVVTSCTPNEGPTYGGAFPVQITGSGFTGATSVNFAGTSYGPAQFTVNSDTQITLPQIPGHAAGVVDVSVTTGAGTGTGTGIFEYVTPVGTSIEFAAWRLIGDTWSTDTPYTIANGAQIDLRIRVRDQWNNRMENVDVTSAHPLYVWDNGGSSGTAGPDSYTTNSVGAVFWNAKGGYTDDTYTLRVGLDLDNSGGFNGTEPYAEFVITWGS